MKTVVLFIVCLVLLHYANKEHIKVVIAEYTKQEAIKQINEWQTKYNECVYDRMKDGQTIKYLDLVIDNLLREEKLKYHPNDSLVVKIF